MLLQLQMQTSTHKSKWGHFPDCRIDSKLWRPTHVMSSIGPAAASRYWATVKDYTDPCSHPALGRLFRSHMHARIHTNTLARMHAHRCFWTGWKFTKKKKTVLLSEFDQLFYLPMFFIFILMGRVCLFNYLFVLFIHSLSWQWLVYLGYMHFTVRKYFTKAIQKENTFIKKEMQNT